MRRARGHAGHHRDGIGVTGAAERSPERHTRLAAASAGRRVRLADREGAPEATCIVAAMSRDDPFVRLPDHIELSLAEASELLEVLDIAATTARTDEERLAVREAVRMITARLWPELGDLLDGDDEA